jgi:hypothetical protein
MRRAAMFDNFVRNSKVAEVNCNCAEAAISRFTRITVKESAFSFTEE